MARKIRTIWDELVDTDEWIDEIREDYPDCDDDELKEIARELLYEYLNDERVNLDKEVEGEIVIIADLGLWNGRRVGYGTTNSTNIKDILNPKVNGQSYCHWYSDGYNICCTESHHDGTNYYKYRVVRPGRDINKLREKILCGEEITTSMINYYTRSLLPEVAAVYGW